MPSSTRAVVGAAIGGSRVGWMRCASRDETLLRGLWPVSSGDVAVFGRSLWTGGERRVWCLAVIGRGWVDDMTGATAQDCDGYPPGELAVKGGGCEQMQCN